MPKFRQVINWINWKNAFPRKKYWSQTLFAVFAQSQVILRISFDWNINKTKNTISMTHLHSLNECGRQKLLISSLFFSEFELLLSIENTQRRNSTHNNIFQLSNFHWNEIIGSPRNEIHEIVKSNRRSPVFISDIYCEFRVRDALGKH